MWELRLILVLIGVVFIAAVYLLSRQRKSRSSERSHRDAPTFTESNLPDVISGSASGSLTSSTNAPALRMNHEITDASATSETEPRQLILSLHVACRGEDGFSGANVLDALQSTGLCYGRYRVFHRLTKDDMRQSVFSVANMVEPGILDPDSLAQMRVPGLTLFLVLPGPQSGVAACADMLATARSLASQLNGEVLDDSRTPLTTQAAQNIRERILEFQQHTAVASRD
jgi:cell division protein ZipA